MRRRLMDRRADAALHLMVGVTGRRLRAFPDPIGFAPIGKSEAIGKFRGNVEIVCLREISNAMSAESSACRNFPRGLLLPGVCKLVRRLQIHRQDKLGQSNDSRKTPENAEVFENTVLHDGSQFPAFFAG